MNRAKSYLEQRHFGDNATSSDVRATICAGLAPMMAPIPGGPDVVVRTLTPTLTAMKAWVGALPADVRLVAMSIVLSVVASASRTWLAAALRVDEDDVVLKVFKDLFGVSKTALSLHRANHELLVRLHDDIVRGDEWQWMMPAHIEALSVAKFRDLAVEEKLRFLRRLRGRSASAKNVKSCKAMAVVGAPVSPGDSAWMSSDCAPYAATDSAVIAARLSELVGSAGVEDVQAARSAIQCMPPNDRLVATGLLVGLLKQKLSMEAILELEEKLAEVGRLDAIQIGLYVAHKELLVYLHDRIRRQALPAWMMPKSIKALSANGLRYQTLPVKVEVLRRLDGKKAVLANVQASMARLMDGPLWDSPRRWSSA